MRMIHRLLVPTLFNGGMICTSAAIVIALIMYTTLVHAGEGMDQTPLRGTIQVVTKGRPGPNGYSTSADVSGIFRDATLRAPSVDAGSLVIDGIEVRRDAREEGVFYHHSTATPSFAHGASVRVTVEGNAETGIARFIDSMYCPASFRVEGLAYDSAKLMPTIKRSQDLVLTWNPDPYNDSVTIMLTEFKMSSQTRDGDTLTNIIMTHVADDGSHTITQSDLSVFDPTVREVTFLITRTVQKEVVHHEQRFLLKGRSTVLVMSTLAD